VDVRDLKVWQDARQLSDEVRLCVELWPRRDQRTMGDQAIRAADSIATNIAEAMGRQTQPLQLHALLIARGSALELETWLDACTTRGLEQPQNGATRIRQIARMINGLIRRRR
jgi:four helix bundle protein